MCGEVETNGGAEVTDPHEPYRLCQSHQQSPGTADITAVQSRSDPVSENIPGAVRLIYRVAIEATAAEEAPPTHSGSQHLTPLNPSRDSTLLKKLAFH